MKSKGPEWDLLIHKTTEQLFSNPQIEKIAYDDDGELPV